MVRVPGLVQDLVLVQVPILARAHHQVHQLLLQGRGLDQVQDQRRVHMQDLELGPGLDQVQAPRLVHTQDLELDLHRGKDVVVVQDLVLGIIKDSSFVQDY